MDVDKLNGELRASGAAADDPSFVREQWQLSQAPIPAHLPQAR